MAKIIIDNQTDLDMVDALELVKLVVGLGRISNGETQYCYATTFKAPMDGVVVYSDLNKGSDKFVIMKDVHNG